MTTTGAVATIQIATIITTAEPPRKSMLLLIADSHLQENSRNLEDFKGLLQRISTTSHDVCFLGDIMELWIALPGFETEYQREFLNWCSQEKGRRKIFFLEGNHEFFVSRYHRNCFSACEPDLLKDGSFLFCHGDFVQRTQSLHRLFRCLSKSLIAWLLLRFLPGASCIVRWIYSAFRRKRMGNPCYHLPAREILDWCEKQLANQSFHVVLGHFHVQHQDNLPAGCRLYCLPAWKDKQEIGICQPDSGQCTFQDWRTFFNIARICEKN